jgi:RNA recognition motif-containing protein
MHSEDHFSNLLPPPRAPQWGPLRDLMILREQPSGLSRGCAFVGFTAAGDAEAVITHLNGRVHLPGAAAPLEVNARPKHRPRT